MHTFSILIAFLFVFNSINAGALWFATRDRNTDIEADIEALRQILEVATSQELHEVNIAFQNCLKYGDPKIINSISELDMDMAKEEMALVKSKQRARNWDLYERQYPNQLVRDTRLDDLEGILDSERLLLSKLSDTQIKIILAADLATAKGPSEEKDMYIKSNYLLFQKCALSQQTKTDSRRQLDLYSLLEDELYQ